MATRTRTSSTSTDITSVPLRTPMLDGGGRLTRSWILFFQALGSSTAVTKELILSVPGTLGIRSSAAPLVVLTKAETAIRFAALVKTAPTGANLVCVLRVDGTAIATLTIADGTTSVVSTTAAGITEGGTLTLDITAVGTTFPGADLSFLMEY